MTFECCTGQAVQCKTEEVEDAQVQDAQETCVDEKGLQESVSFTFRPRFCDVAVARATTKGFCDVAVASNSKSSQAGVKDDGHPTLDDPST
eukprot:2329920-Amphidinium_carterae.2